jgi:ribosomal silencing factor RsfS
MTKEQADLFFPYSPDDDLEDLWEQRLFEQKQFFLTRPPIRMVWMSRIKKLEKQFQAFLVLTEQEKTEDIVPIQIKNELIFSEYFVAAFHQFHKQRNSYKSELLQAQSYNALVELIERWLSTELEYAKYWIVEESKNNDIEAIRSKEPDPMELLKVLKEAAVLIDSPLIEVLKENYNILPENVKKEVKRLTLLTKV